LGRAGCVDRYNLSDAVLDDGHDRRVALLRRSGSGLGELLGFNAHVFLASLSAICASASRFTCSRSSSHVLRFDVRQVISAASWCRRRVEVDHENQHVARLGCERPDEAAAIAEAAAEYKVDPKRVIVQQVSSHA
jgi:hypothetical protein